MNFLIEFRNYIIALIVFLAIDMVWLLGIAKNLYSESLGYLMAKNPNMIAAFVFYMIFVVGILYFVINPAIASGDIIKLIITALLFGFITYATYDLTNLATIKNWPIKITLIDLIWGSTVTTLTSVISYYIIKLF